MTTETTRPNTVYKKIAAVMAEIGAIKPDARHQQGFQYRSADHVFAVIQRAMIKHNLIVLSQALQAEHMEDGQSIVHYIFTFVDPETGDSHACQWIGGAVHTRFKFKDGDLISRTINDKAMNQSATNALKYFLLETFLVNGQDPEIDAEQQDEILVSRTNGSKPAGQGKTESTKATGWATLENLSVLFAMAIEKYPGVTDKEIAASVGMTKSSSSKEWNEKFATGKEAGKAIMAALDKTVGKSGAGDIDVSTAIKDLAEQKSLPDIDEPDLEDQLRENQYDKEKNPF